MPRHQVVIEHHFASDPATVFAFFADHEQFGRLWPGRTRRIATGQDDPNGVGSVREIRLGPVRFEETVVTFQRPHLIEYTVTRGSPIKNHHGRIEFHPEGTGCRIDYRIRFDGRFPLIGALVARNLPRDFTAGLAAVGADLR